VLTVLADADPRAVGPYRVSGRLGAGGMGAVYLGFDAGGAPVAVKVIRPDLVDDTRLRERFRHEVAAARRVRGRYVARVRDADAEAASPWMATDYVEGVSLAAAVSEHRGLTGPMLMGLAGGLANAVAAIHAAALVHRDLKPSNILLAWDGPKIIDFGIARALDDTSHTGTGDVLGTASWMSPEQLRGERVGPASDVFAWAMCVVFAARGRHAFPAPSPAASAMRVLADPPDLAGVPESLVPLLTAALDKDPSRRPDAVALVSSMVGREVTSLADAEDASRSLLGDGWMPPPPPQLSAPPTGPLPVASPSTALTPGRRRLAVIAAAVLVAASGLFGWLLVPSGGRHGHATAAALIAQRRTAARPATRPSGATTIGAPPRRTAAPVPTGATAVTSAAPSLAVGPVPDATRATPASHAASSPAPAPAVPAPTAAPVPLPPTVALTRYNSGPDHASLTSSPPSGYHSEGSLGLLYTTGAAAGTHPIYACWFGTDEFTSLRADCEGQRVIGLLGWVYDSAPADPATHPLMRCKLGGEHFDSNDTHCEGQEVEALLGYTRAS
jgi:eukaryotic-like serine/threonine-protein kinase